ncbi:hypothetical protein E1264_25925 [Actinomadura sp. KC216]|uniref:hypothetical protein n=1 Tax=Actinomadura sp. KC216 TaxID=2530370 RepID=UPI001042AF52|nr:hypothetical protein [Actinomadura sp. KC216]TDB84105.1 hypothetical protein E1264_25925 [Actinomadura sp. KC216]
MAISLPVRFRSDGVRVSVETDPLHAPLRDFLINDLGEDVSAIARARGRLSDSGRPGVSGASGGPNAPWQELFRYHRLDFDGTFVHVRDVAGWASCDVDPVVLRKCLDEYLQEIGALHSRRSLERVLSEAPSAGEPMATSLALGSVSHRTQGWGLVQTPRAVLEDVAGLTPHPDACVPHGVLETGSGACWADLAVWDETGIRLRSGTKTFMPRGIDPERLMAELGKTLTQARFVSAVPGAWSGVVAGVPVHGYVDPEAVLRLPCEPIEVGGVVHHVRVFFPELGDSGVDLEAAASGASEFAQSVNGQPHVLVAFLLHDVQSHRHHLDVVRQARPGWEHTGNACHLRLDVQTVRLEHLWLPGHACEVPTGEFASVLYEYERRLAG